MIVLNPKLLKIHYINKPYYLRKYYIRSFKANTKIGNDVTMFKNYNG